MLAVGGEGGAAEDTSVKRSCGGERKSEGRKMTKGLCVHAPVPSLRAVEKTSRFCETR